MKENKKTVNRLATRATYEAPQVACYTMEAEEGILSNSVGPLTIGSDGGGNNGHQDKGYGTEGFGTKSDGMSSIISSRYSETP